MVQNTSNKLLAERDELQEQNDILLARIEFLEQAVAAQNTTLELLQAMLDRELTRLRPPKREVPHGATGNA